MHKQIIRLFPRRGIIHPVRIASLAMMVIALVYPCAAVAEGIPEWDKTRYHTWEEVNGYLEAVSAHPKLRNIVSLIPIGFTREGRSLRILRISRKGILGSYPDAKPAAFIMGAHHAREHISKEAVLALIDKIIHGYGRPSTEGQAITYLVDAGTFYLLPWVNPDGGTHEFFHNPEQRKTNYSVDEPQIGAADCDTCGDGLADEDTPDIATGDVGAVSNSGRTILFADNGIIGRHLQLWYEDGSYAMPVLDERVARIQPAGSGYTFNYEGLDPDNDGDFYPYSGEDWIGGTDPNRNYGEPLWGDCGDDDGCSWLSGAQTYAGPAPFSEPETASVAAFLRAHPNIISLESLHSGINEIYPPWFLFPDDPGNDTMDQAYHDAVAQYISQQTGYEVVYGGPYAVKGDTTGYSYFGSSQDPGLGLDFYAGGLLSFTTEIYGMGSTSGSAEAVRDWFPHHWQQFDTDYPQGLFIAWSDFPWCTTCDPDQMPGPGTIFDYVQYTEYLVFNSRNKCGGATDPGVFHCDYWGIGESPGYYADFDIFAYFNPPSADRCYKDWNCNGSAIVRTVDKQLKHLMYRLYVAPFIKFNAQETAGDSTRIDLAVENTGFLRSSVMTAARNGEDPMTYRHYDFGHIEVRILYAAGFSVLSPREVNIGWLGGGISEDPQPIVKRAAFEVSGLSAGDLFVASADSEKTGCVMALFQVDAVHPTCPADAHCPPKLKLRIKWSNHVERSNAVDAYFTESALQGTGRALVANRGQNRIKADIARAEKKRQQYKPMEGPFDLIPNKAKAISIKKYH